VPSPLAKALSTGAKTKRRRRSEPDPAAKPGHGALGSGLDPPRYLTAVADARWDPDRYLEFEKERGRPFDDLISHIRQTAPKRVVDLGCGPGNTTARLLDRWPDAQVTGIDSSSEMISQAKELEVPGRLEFRVGDLRGWQPSEPVDVLLCAATFQWIPDHVSLFPRLVESLTPGGTFAFQVPNNFDEPSHTLLHELATSDRWREVLQPAVRAASVLEPRTYLTELLSTGAEADVWETTYLHVLHGPDAVLRWIQGTGLRPFLSALEQSGSPTAVDDFLGSYAAALRAAYPRDPHGRVVFPFRRIFAVSVAPDPGGGLNPPAPV
jgi:trans-aconitate 2-methyltransferase